MQQTKAASVVPTARCLALALLACVSVNNNHNNHNHNNLRPNTRRALYGRIATSCCGKFRNKDLYKMYTYIHICKVVWLGQIHFEINNEIVVCLLYGRCAGAQLLAFRLLVSYCLTSNSKMDCVK